MTKDVPFTALKPTAQGSQSGDGQKRLHLALDQRAQRRLSDKDQDPVRRGQAHRAAPPEALCYELGIAHRGEPETAPAHAPAPQITAHRTAQHLVKRAGVEQPLEGGIDDGAGRWHGGEHRGAHPTPTTPFATCSPVPTDAESQPNGIRTPGTRRWIGRRAERAIGPTPSAAKRCGEGFPGSPDLWVRAERQPSVWPRCPHGDRHGSIPERPDSTSVCETSPCACPARATHGSSRPRYVPLA